MKILLFVPLLILSLNTSASCYEVIAKADHYKPNGKQWDIASSPPDIMACFIDSWGKRCKARNIKVGKMDAWCKDIYCWLASLRSNIN